MRERRIGGYDVQPVSSGSPHWTPAALVPFVSAIRAWEWAMTGAAAPPNPISLLPMAHIEMALEDLAGARAWAAAIAVVVTNAERSIAEAHPVTDTERQEVDKWRDVLEHLRRAHAHALEHVATLVAASLHQPPE